MRNSDLFALFLLLIGCTAPDPDLERQREEFKNMTPPPVLPVPPTPTPSPGVGSPAAIAESPVWPEIPPPPATPKPVTVFLATGSTWCASCIRWGPAFDSALGAAQGAGLVVRRRGRSQPSPAHFVELEYPLLPNGQLMFPTPLHAKLVEKAGGQSSMRFPGFYAVTVDWEVVRSWCPDDGDVRPWEGVKTLDWLRTGEN